MADQELCFLSATELVRRMRVRENAAAEVMAAHLAQIERVNPLVNALVTLAPEQAMQQAHAADQALARGEPVGPLHGLPVAHKDAFLTRGMRTTFGSPIYREYIPDQNALIVDRLQAAGAISVGKSNTPEFTAGGQTFNAVFGATLNPYDRSKTCGGSSGGAAVALACGMAPLADGTDIAGSLRTPASFCNVVGLRPSINRVPSWPTASAWSLLQADGPMARTVQDVALMLSAIAGPDRRAPLALSEPGSLFARPLARDFRGVRVAWSSDLGGLPFDPRVTAVVESQRHVFDELGCVVTEATPDFTDADEVFQILRAWHFELNYGELLREHRALIKDTVIWNIEAGQKLTGPQLGRAERLRTALYQRVSAFMEQHEFLILPMNQVPPFPVEQPYIEEINGVTMETYIDWLRSCYFITVNGLPAISVPCGFTPDGLPIGIQIVGRCQDDWGVLQLAYAFEQATQVGQRRPAIVDDSNQESGVRRWKIEDRK